MLCLRELKNTSFDPANAKHIWQSGNPLKKQMLVNLKIKLRIKKIFSEILIECTVFELNPPKTQLFNLFAIFRLKKKSETYYF